MWRPLKILEENYFFQCSVADSFTSFYLYNLKEVWSEKCSVEDVIQRAKELNKRILYDEDTVLSTIKAVTPTSSTLNSSEEGLDLNLKYHVVGKPLSFEWKLRPLAADDVQALVTYPLFMSIYYMSEQIKELKTIIKKKDIEIGEYKAEGAILKRTTVETQKFNEEQYDSRYSEVRKISEGLFNISESIKGNFPEIEVAAQPVNKVVKPSDKFKKSPNKAKKRKFFERNRIHMEKIIKAKNETMEYLSSQSQSPPREEIAEILQSLGELDAKRLASI